MAAVLAILLALVTQAAPAEGPSDTASPSQAEDVRCVGVLYAAQMRLNQRDPRQPRIVASVQAAIARIEARVEAGEASALSVEADMQTAVNEAVGASDEQIAACLTASVEP